MSQFRKQYLAGACAMALMFSVWGGVTYSAETVTELFQATTEKAVGDRFSITDFNDIWSFIKTVFVGDNDTPADKTDDRIGIGGAPSADLKFDVSGKLGATNLCDEDGSNCRDLSDEYAFAAPRGAFVGTTSATTDGSVISGGLAGYAAANAFCVAGGVGFENSHLCSMSELVATLSTIVIWEEIITPTVCPTPATHAFYPNSLGDTNDDGDGDAGEFCMAKGWTGNAWVNGGASKYAATTVHVDDCEGWTYDVGSSHRGNFWNFDAGTVGVTSPKNGGGGGVTACNLALKLACCR